MTPDETHPFRNVRPLEIGFVTRDLEQALGFWRDLMEFEQVSRIDTPHENAVASGIAPCAYTVVRLQLPTGERLKLFAPVELSAERPPVPTPLSTPGFAFFTHIVSDLDAVMSRMDAEGADILAGRHNLRDGVDVALVRDPDGIIVEFVEYADISAYRP